MGVGGAVPCPWNSENHIRLGDVVISTSLDDAVISTSLDGVVNQLDAISALAICNECFKIDVDKLERLKLTRGRLAAIPDAFSGKSWFSSSDHLQRRVERVKPDMKKLVDIFVSEATKYIGSSDFMKPSYRTDKLYIVENEEKIFVEHPTSKHVINNDTCDSEDHQKQSSNIFFSSVSCGKYLARNDWLRGDFARATNSKCYVNDDVCVTLKSLSSLDQLPCSVMIVSGMADYVDGRTRKRWQSYASLCAAATIKAIFSVEIGSS